MMRVSLAAALLAAAILAACGGSTTSKTTGAPAAAVPTKAEFIARADPICAAASKRAPTKRILALIGQFPTPTTEIARLLRKTVTIVHEVTRRLTAIPPPPADKTAIDQFIAQGAAIGGMLSKAADQVQRGDLVAAVKSQQDIAAATIDPTTFAKGYGLQSCSTIGG